MLDTSKRVVIVGLGLLGGRYALGLTRAGFAVDGIDRSPEAVEFALKEGYIQRGATENFAPLLAEAGYVVLGLYPTALLDWLKQYGSLLPAGCLATDTCGAGATGVLLLVRAEQYADLCWQATAAGVLILSKPTPSALLLQSLTLLCGTRERLRRMEQKTVSMEDRMEEIRLVNRAKWVLIDQLRMTEQEAHRYIEKQAMDRCVTRRAVAESILATYR